MPPSESTEFDSGRPERLEHVGLPSRLKHLTSRFDSALTSLDHVQLPESLERLELGYYSNQSLDHVDFPCLTSLSLGAAFNQSLERVKLPDSLTTLQFGFDFNQPLNRVNLPQKLADLTFGDAFNQSILEVRWPTLTTHLWRQLQPKPAGRPVP